MVTDTAAVEQVADGDDGIIAGLAPDAVWADMSTISPDASREIAARVADKGAAMLDAPVSGSITTLEQGQLAIMVGGDQRAFARIEPVLSAIGPTVTRVGEKGQALETKIAVNLALVVQVIGFCEGVALAERAGVPREAAVEAMLNSVVSSPVLRYRGPLILEGAMPDEPPANVDLQQKDLLLALELGRRLGVPLPTAAACNELLNAARGTGIAEHDFVVVYDVYRLLVVSGRGEIYTDHGREPAAAGDVVFTPAGHWHGFDNTSDSDVLLFWGWRGAGSLAAAGYELPDER